MFLLVSVLHVGAHPGERQHGVSIQISINLGKTFPPLSHILNIPLTWIFARVFAYLPPFISQIPDFIFWTVLIFFIYFEWRNTENPQYEDGHLLKHAEILLDFMQCLKNISLYKYLFTRKRENKAYFLNVESKLIPVYCHMKAAELGACGGGGWTLVMKTDGEKVAAASQQFLPPQGFRPGGEIPRRHSSNSRVY